MAEIRELLGDIIADGRRASDVVRGIRGMVKKEQVARRSVDLNEVVMDAVRMASPDAAAAFVPVGNFAGSRICRPSTPTRFNFNRSC